MAVLNKVNIRPHRWISHVGSVSNWQCEDAVGEDVPDEWRFAGGIDKNEWDSDDAKTCRIELVDRARGRGRSSFIRVRHGRVFLFRLIHMRAWKSVSGIEEVQGIREAKRLSPLAANENISESKGCRDDFPASDGPKHFTTWTLRSAGQGAVNGSFS